MLRDELLTPEIRRIHAENYGVYKARKIWYVLRREGWQAGCDRLARLMRQAGLSGMARARKSWATIPAQVFGLSP